VDWRAGCAHATTSPDPIVVAESPVAGVDLRDVLDRGLVASNGPRPDVVVTRDPAVVSYAAGSRDYITVVLPYDRTYVLVSADTSPLPTPADRDALARNAVTADARGAKEPFAWLADTSCTGAPGSPAASPGIVAYAADDPIARQLAERIVALAAARPAPAWVPGNLSSRATGLRVAAMWGDSITAALATGRAAAAIIGITRGPLTHCGVPAAPLAWRGVPLVDSRAHAIVRRGSGAAFVINDDGTLHFVRRKSP